jgi:hypothetical protein
MLAGTVEAASALAKSRVSGSMGNLAPGGEPDLMRQRLITIISPLRSQPAVNE